MEDERWDICMAESTMKDEIINIDRGLMELKNFVVTEILVVQKAKCHVLPLTRSFLFDLCACWQGTERVQRAGNYKGVHVRKRLWGRAVKRWLGHVWYNSERGYRGLVGGARGWWEGLVKGREGWEWEDWEKGRGRRSLFKAKSIWKHHKETCYFLSQLKN